MQGSCECQARHSWFVVAKFSTDGGRNHRKGIGGGGGGQGARGGRWRGQGDCGLEHGEETKAEEVTNDVSEVLETAEEISETIDLSVGDETSANEEATVENTRAALVDFVYSRLNKKSTNKGE